VIEDLDLRPVAPDDAEFLQQLAHARWAHLPSPELADLQARAQERQYSEQWGGEGHHLIWLNGERVGRVWWADTDADRQIVDIAVLPAAQGSGVGTAVLARLVTSAGGRCLRASTDVDKPGWRRQFASLGFVETGSDGLVVHLEHAAEPERAPD
jgi:GNAT superfamily N-acetyltransferase